MFKPVDANQNFVEMEKKWLSYWDKNGIIKKYLEKNKKAQKTFSFMDGPITANNPMGVHHAWGRTYKDLWQKFYNLLGYRQRFQNGFDCQGLWVEVEVEKELEIHNKKDIENLVNGDPKASIAKFVDMCKARVYKYSDIQREQTKRLGNFMDWDHSYFTMSDNNNYMIWHFLKICFDEGWIYKGHESVPWCPRCETAISQHEMLTEDYKELVHESIYFKLPIIGRDNEFLLVWTTTPWTLPGNIAVAVDEKLDYSLIEDLSGEKYWIASEAGKRIFTGSQKILKTVKGKSLTGLQYQTAFDVLTEAKKISEENPGKFHVVIATDDQIMPISALEGTGLVHTAVSAGVEDFRLGKKLGLPMIPLIADNADYLPTLDFLSGKNAKKHPEVIFDYLKDRENAHDERWIFKIERYKHRYPACWRCKTELVWKVADEWYIAMDRPSTLRRSSGKSGTLRQRMMESAKKIQWMPEFGLDRELDWLKNMHDWLISKKNRYWGLALPIYECKACGTFEVIGSKKELKEKAIEGWEQFEGKTPHKPYIDDVIITCKNCGESVSRISDVGNPWLDAGIVPFSTIVENNQGEPLYFADRKKWKEWFPINFITESFPGQFKNWFYALIAMSTVLENTNPTERILGYGTLVGEDGRPMHKSWGNSVEFNEGADKIGVDVMRWMYARQNPADNMLFGYKKADEIRRQFYLILWNSYKFYIEYANLEKFNSHLNRDKVGNSKNILDCWIVSKFSLLVKTLKENLLTYNAKDSMEEIESFINLLSTWYIRRGRDRVWVNSEDEEDKSYFYITLNFVFENLAVILSPILPFLSEEIYTNLTQFESVHLAQWPHIDEKLIDTSLNSAMNDAREVASIILMNRKLKNIPISTKPLLRVGYKGPRELSDEIKKIVSEETNIDEIIYEGASESGAYEPGSFDVSDKNINIEKGKAREIRRKIQAARKVLNTNLDEKVDVYLPEWPINFEKEIKKKALVNNLIKSDDFRVERIR